LMAGGNGPTNEKEASRRPMRMGRARQAEWVAGS